MGDVHDKMTRSYNMSQIKGKDTKPEIIVRKFLFSKGLRYRLNQKELPGKPDIVLKKYQTVIFINGCFWHSHENCKYFVIPKSNSDFWINKLHKNKANDNKNKIALEELGWKVTIIWECELKKNKIEETLNSLLSFFK
jgi:DNA mismatch endonuclease (patch repair protein)